MLRNTYPTIGTPASKIYNLSKASDHSHPPSAARRPGLAFGFAVTRRSLLVYAAAEITLGIGGPASRQAAPAWRLTGGTVGGEVALGIRWR